MGVFPQKNDIEPHKTFGNKCKGRQDPAAPVSVGAGVGGARLRGGGSASRPAQGLKQHNTEHVGFSLESCHMSSNLCVLPLYSLMSC